MAISKKLTNPSSTLHPPYLQMIGEAISLLKDRTGSSQQAIAKFIEDQYKSLLPPNFKKILSIQLKKFVKLEKLVKIKNSYKISALEKVKSVSRTTKELQKKNEVKKMKRLSQVKTPEAVKKKLGEYNASNDARKMKRLSQIKKVSRTSAKMNGSKSVKSSRPAHKKDRT